MKKTLILTTLLCISVIGVLAQDTITLKNGEDIKGTVQEIGDSYVKYKKYENLNGPTYTLLKSDIFMIKYENGTKDILGQSSVPTPAPAPHPKPATEAVRLVSQTISPQITVAESDSPKIPPMKKPYKNVLFGIKAGLAMSNVDSKNYKQGGSMEDWTVSPRLGLTGGLLVEFRVAKIFSIQPEFLLTMKGCKREGYTDLYSVSTGDLTYQDVFEEWNLNFTYIEIPVNLIFNIPIKKDRLQIGAGPYVAYGIAGKSRSHFSYNGINIDDEVIDSGLKYDLFSGEKKMYEPLDWGINCIVGYQFGFGFFINAGYSFGLTSMADDVSVKNNNIHFSLGFKF